MKPLSRAAGALVAIALAMSACDDGGGDALDADTVPTDGEVTRLDMTSGTDAAPQTADAEVVDAGIDPVDAAPRPAVKHPGWCVRTQTEDGTLRSTVTRSYDAQGRLVEEVSVRADGDPTATTTWERDAQGRLTRKRRQVEGRDLIFPDETYIYGGDGLLSEAIFAQPADEVYRWTLESEGGRYTTLREFTNEDAAPTYQTLDWDLEADRLLAINTRATDGDAAEGFAQFTYKARNPGQGKVESESIDDAFRDGSVDRRRSYRYESMMGLLERSSTQLFDRAGNPIEEGPVSTWEHLFLSGLNQVRSWSVDGEVRETYAYVGDTVEVTAGCTVMLYAGTIAEVQTPGGLVGFSPEEGGQPEFAGPTAGFAPTGRRLSRTECDGTVSYEISFDAAGNPTGEREGAFESTYTYDCWD